MLKRLAALALCACAPVHAAPVLDQGRLQQLANTPYWLAIGHYETAKLGGWRSYVDDDDFFLSPDGPHDPAVDKAGPQRAVGTDDDEMFGAYMYSRAQSVMGGTSQIQKNIIAGRILGLGN